MFKELSTIFSQLKINPDYKPSRQHESKNSPPHEIFDFIKLVQSWEDIVGKKLSKHTHPFKNVNKTRTLHIYTNNSAFSQDLSFMQETIIKKICAHFPSLNGKIKKLVFTYNPTFFLMKENEKENTQNLKKRVYTDPALHPLSPLHKKLSKEADEIFSHIDDQELKNLLKSAYIQGHAKDQ